MNENVKNYKFVTLIILIIIFSFLQNANSYDNKEIRIGQWGPQTGPAASWGAMARGSKLAFDIVNEEGGIHGRKIKYFIRDDQYNPTQTIVVVKDLVERQNVSIIVGGLGTATALAVKDYLQQKKIIWVGVLSGSKAFHKIHNQYLWNIWPSYEDDGSIIAKYLVETREFKKIGYIYQNDDWGKDALIGINKRLKKYNMNLIEALPVEPTEINLTSQILRLRDSGAEAIIGFMTTTQTATALKYAVSINYHPQWIHSYNISDNILMNKLTDGLWTNENVMNTEFMVNIFDYNNPLIKKYHDAMKRLAPNERWSVYYAAGFVSVEPLIYALKKSGKNLTNEKLKTELDKITNFQGIGPKITWTQTNHKPPKMFRIQKSDKNSVGIIVQDWTINEL